MTKSYAMALDLKDDAALIERYIEHHRAVWPEALESLGRLGIEKMKIFLLGRRLFMYVEVPDDFDFPADLARYTEQPRARELGRVHARLPGEGARRDARRVVGADGAGMGPLRLAAGGLGLVVAASQ